MASWAKTTGDAKAPRPSKGLSKRSEAQILLTAGVLTLVIVSTFTLFAYRNAVRLTLEERQQEASRFARRLSRELDGALLPRAEELSRRRGPARAIVVLDEAGRSVVASGDVSVDEPRHDTRWLGWELAPPAPDVVSAAAPLELGGRPYSLRVDLPARQLRASQRALAILQPLVIGVNVAMALLLLLYWQHLWAPFDRLIQRARKAGRVAPADDEMGFLLQTFEEALVSLQESPGDELDALESTLVRSLESGVMLCDPAGRVLALNRIGATFLGIDEPAAGGLLPDVLGHHPDLLAALERAIHEGRGVSRGEFTLADGEGERTLGLTLHPLRRDDDSVRGYLMLFLDLTAVRRRAEERRLAESLAQLGELAAGVAHETRNAVASLVGYLALIERRGPGPDIAEYVAEMRHEANHLKRVVDDFLSFARPGSARTEEIDLVRVLRRAAADPALEGVAVRFDDGFDEGGEARVGGDAQLLERAFTNLLRNAAEAERQGRGEAIEIAWQRIGAAVEVTIDDHGPGLPPELRERLFHPFVSGRPGGVGLGLALTHRILELHGGSVRLEDRAGGGARAVVVLPADGAAHGEDDGAIATNRNQLEDASSPAVARPDAG